MGLTTGDMKLDSRDRAVLEALADGQANPRWIRDRTDLDKGDINTVLVRLGRAGYVEQLTRGLYRITEKGRDEIGVEDDLEAAREDLKRALEHREWSAVEDAAARLGVETDG